jgi:hypothetical protein
MHKYDIDGNRSIGWLVKDTESERIAVPVDTISLFSNWKASLPRYESAVDRVE